MLLRQVAARFDRLQARSGEGDWVRLEGLKGDGPIEFARLAPYAAEGPTLERQSIRELEGAEEKPLPGKMLTMLARARPGSAPG